MSESNDERIARKKAERQEIQRQRERAEEEALAAASDNEPGVAEWLDADLDAGMTEILGMSPKDLQAALSASIPDLTAVELDQALEDAKRARKALEGGWLSSPDPAEAEKILMRNGKIVELNKKRKGGWCAVVALLILTAAGSAAGGLAYGAAELLAALAR